MTKKLPMKRRRFLQLSAATAATASLPLGPLGCTGGADGDPDGGGEPQRPTLDPDDYDGGETQAFAADDATLDEATYALGVSSGMATATSALFWGHASDAAAHRLVVWRDKDGSDEKVVVFDGAVSPTEGGALRQTVDSLAPATAYRFAFFDGGDPAAPASRSTIGTTKTAYPEGWLWPVTIAAATCTSWENMPYVALSKMAEQDPDLFVHLGDSSYNDGARTVDEYRALWSQTLADPGYRAILPATSMRIAWDDHEITNNLNPETIDPDHLAAGKSAFFEMLPQDPGDNGELWHSVRWGDTLELIVLDCRTERQPSTLQSGDEKYMSQAQMDWFKETLKNSPCHFKVVLNSVPMTEMPELWALTSDRWQGYAADREEVLAHLEENDIDNVWFLAGDFHMGFVSRLEKEGFRSRLKEVAVGPTGNLGNPLGLLAELEEHRESVFPADQFFYGKGALCQTLLTFDPLEDAVRFQFIDAESDEVYFDEWLTRES